MRTYKLFSFGGLLLLLAGILATGRPVLAASESTSGGLLMVTADTARITALGGAGGALPDDPGVMFYNPAGLISIQRIEGLFTHQMGIAEDTSEVLNLVVPLSVSDSLGVAFVYHGMPDLNDAGGDQAAVKANDMLGQISLGRTGDEILHGFTYGASLKFLNSVLGEYTAKTVAADLGVQWHASDEVLLGLAINNLGMPLKFIDDADPLPMRIILSGKYDMLQGFMEKLFAVMDVEQTLENETRVHLGGEFLYSSMVALRMGYVIAPGSTDGFAFGLGIRAGIGACTLRFDYAYKMTNWSSMSFDGSHLLTIGLVY